MVGNILHHFVMKTKTSTLIGVARLSMKLAGRLMQPYSHLKGPKKFTQLQLMSCLVLRAYTLSNSN
jgi:hypothetical protein